MGSSACDVGLLEAGGEGRGALEIGTGALERGGAGRAGSMIAELLSAAAARPARKRADAARENFIVI